MKKLICVLMIAAIVACGAFALTACNNDGGVDNSLLFGKELITLTSQLDVLTQLNSGSADIGVIDSIMAGYYMTTGTYASTLQMVEGLDLAEEEYGIAAKKGNSALISKINEALIALADNGQLDTVANNFGLATELLVTEDTANPNASATDNSWSSIVSSGKLVVGYTEFAPIAYKDANDNFTGFDIELARKAVEYLNTTYSCNVAIEFSLIEWEQKEALLANGSIDLVWNGMTINEERIAGMELSVPYLANKQAIVIRKADAGKYGTLSAFLKNADDAIVAVENGSAGQDCVQIA